MKMERLLQSFWVFAPETYLLGHCLTQPRERFKKYKKEIREGNLSCAIVCFLCVTVSLCASLFLPTASTQPLQHILSHFCPLSSLGGDSLLNVGESEYVYDLIYGKKRVMLAYFLTFLLGSLLMGLTIHTSF